MGVRVAVYGGSFNPPHVGHAMVTSWLLWTGQVDEVWLMPAFSHAFGKEMADFTERFQWCQALASMIGAGVRARDDESKLPAPSYTIRTMEHLAELHPEDELRFVLGSDAAATLSEWHRSAELVERFRPIIVGRQGYASLSDAPDFPGISSTEVRRRLAAGEDVSALVPEAVLRLLRGQTDGL